MANNNPACTVTIPCRMGFPTLFNPRAFKAGAEPKYEMTVMIPKSDEASVAAVRAAMAAAYNDQWADGKGPKLDDQHVCLHDGANKEHPINHEFWLVSAKSKRRPVVVGLDKKTPVGESDGLVYGGANAYANIRIYAMPDKGNDRLCCSLDAVWCCGGGEPFGAAPVDPEVAFAGATAPAQAEGAGGWQP